MPTGRPAAADKYSCSPAACNQCKKITWGGYGASAEQVLASIPKEVVHLLTGW